MGPMTVGPMTDRVPSLEEELKGLAGKLISVASEQLGVTLGYDAESVAWADGFIERQRLRFPGSEADGLVNIIGAFLGECIIARYGGGWREQEGAPGVFFDDENAVFPFAKVRKQFDNGREGGDSIESLYRTIGPVFKR
jgi:hypothetical protein